VIVDPELALFTHTLNRVPADFYYEQKETFLKKISYLFVYFTEESKSYQFGIVISVVLDFNLKQVTDAFSYLLSCNNVKYFFRFSSLKCTVRTGSKLLDSSGISFIVTPR